MNMTSSIDLNQHLSKSNTPLPTPNTNTTRSATPTQIDHYPAPKMEHPAYRNLTSRRGSKFWRIHEVPKLSALRRQTEALIHKQYSSVHNANISEFLPDLFTISDESTMLGAVGIRRFDEQTTLVEQYLDTPVEATIRRTMEVNPARSHLVEVGNLAAKTISDAIRLIAFLCHETKSRGFDYAIFTGIQSVRVALRRLHINYVEIQVAEPLKLDTDTTLWGRYYENDPKVMIVDVACAAAAATTIFGIE